MQIIAMTSVKTSESNKLISLISVFCWPLQVGINWVSARWTTRVRPSTGRGCRSSAPTRYAASWIRASGSTTSSRTGNMWPNWPRPSIRPTRPSRNKSSSYSRPSASTMPTATPARSMLSSTSRTSKVLQSALAWFISPVFPRNPAHPLMISPPFFFLSFFPRLTVSW